MKEGTSGAVTPRPYDALIARAQAHVDNDGLISHENGRELLAALTACVNEREQLVAALRRVLARYDPESGTIDASPDPGCIECTLGTTPNHLNTGLCARHSAEALLSARKAGEPTTEDEGGRG